MVAEYITSYLNTEGIGTSGTDLFYSFRPNTPDDCIILYDEVGPDEGYQNDYGADTMGLQVMTRGSYAFSHSKIWTIHKKILGLKEIDATDFYLKVVRKQTDPRQIEVDEEGRRIYTAHYDVLTNSYNDEHRTPLTTP